MCSIYVYMHCLSQAYIHMHTSIYQNIIHLCNIMLYIYTFSFVTQDIKWPTERKKVIPDSMPHLSLLEAFSWPSKALEKLAELQPSLLENGNPLVLEKRCLRVVSNFSGVCSSSRSLQALQAQANFKLSFTHVPWLL